MFSEPTEGRSEHISDDLIEGRMECDDCPDLKKLVESVKRNELGREEFEQIIDYHLKINEEIDKLNNII
jgi:hypothetical protein